MNKEERLTKLKMLCLEGIKKPIFQPNQPESGVTHCNSFVSFVARGLGFGGFDGLMANQIVDRMKNAADFALVVGKAAQEIANDGRLVVAGQKGDVMMNGHLDHGHVSVVFPGAMIFSGKWNEEAPLLANVGKENKVFGANYAFKEKPEYWVWINET